jgi:hypothetical protein
MRNVSWALFVFLVTSGCAREAPETIREVPVPNRGGGGASGNPSIGEGGDIATDGGWGGGGGGTDLSEITPQVPHLNESHSGYGQALCFTCHGSVSSYLHGSEAYRPTDCVRCHGYNGAPHRDHAVVSNPGCPDCHSSVEHTRNFKAPVDCVKCHYQR